MLHEKRLPKNWPAFPPVDTGRGNTNQLPQIVLLGSGRFNANGSSWSLELSSVHPEPFKGMDKKKLANEKFGQHFPLWKGREFLMPCACRKGGS